MDTNTSMTSHIQYATVIGDDILQLCEGQFMTGAICNQYRLMCPAFQVIQPLSEA